MIANCAVASVIIPYASEEIHAASVALSARKRVTFDVVVKKQSYKVNPNDTVWSFRDNNTYILPLSLDGYMNNPQEIGGLYIEGIVFYNP